MAKTIQFKAEFKSSAGRPEDLPKTGFPEFAFIGRSNVGKSSLINAITSQQGLAKISSQPGKTQTINHFIINSQFYLVDMPGYGYAKVSKDLREKWRKFSEWYLREWPKLVIVFVLIDSRIPPQKVDLEFLQWLGERNVPLGILFTKCDKPKSKELEANFEQFKKALLESWEELPLMMKTSSNTLEGIEDLKTYIIQTYKSLTDS